MVNGNADAANAVAIFLANGQLNGIMPIAGGDAEEVLATFARIGIDTADLATQLQREGTEFFVKSWQSVTGRIAAKTPPTGAVAPAPAEQA